MATGKSSFLAAVFLISMAFAGMFQGVTSYDRPKPRPSVFIRRRRDLKSSSPEQVHISSVGEDKMRITWITKGDAPSTVEYGTSPGAYTNSSTGTSSSYIYSIYKSGKIHEAVIGPLMPNTVYYYCCRSDLAREFKFKTPPSQLPIKFVIIGDLGQTGWTYSTLNNIAKSGYDMLLLPGDLSYADSIQPLWDSFGRLTEPLASQRPWMVTQGNHEIEMIPIIHGQSFTAYNARWHMPFEESGSNSNLYYSFNAAGVHVIMLGSYTNFNPDSEQYKWLQADLSKVDRKKTPWLLVLLHAPWYNTNKAHQGESASVDMKKFMESLLYKARVDAVFAGHVHAYERFDRVYDGKADKCGPMHIAVGDGGNREGLAKEYIDPKPSISLFRQASFGHGELEVFNTTHALWTWHVNDNDRSIIGDSVWLRSLTFDASCKM